MTALPDPETPFGQRVRQRLRDERIVWLTTVDTSGAPQPNPVWFLWPGDDTVLVWNKAGARRLDHIAVRPKVALNFNGQTGDIVVLAGTAIRVDRELASSNAGYVSKYCAAMARVSGSVDQMGRDYPVALEITITRVRGR